MIIYRRYGRCTMQEYATLTVKLITLGGDILATSREFRKLHFFQVCFLLSPKTREDVLKYNINYVLAN